MKSSNPLADSSHSIDVETTFSGSGFGSVESQALEEESSLIPSHPLAIKPSGNQYTATVSNARHSTGVFQVFPDEILSILLEYLDSNELLLLGSTCKALYAFCRSDELWKTLFIEYVVSHLVFKLESPLSGGLQGREEYLLQYFNTIDSVMIYVNVT